MKTICFLIAATSSGIPLLDIALQYGLAGLVIFVGGWGAFKLVTRVFDQYDKRIAAYQKILESKDKRIDEVNEKRVAAATAAVEALKDSNQKLEDIHELLEDVPDSLAKVKGLTDRVNEQQDLVLGLYDALDKAPPARWRRDGR